MKFLKAKKAPQTTGTPKEGPICFTRDGSRVTLWSPHGIPEAFIIAHPDEPPRLVHFDDTEEELTVKDGLILLPKEGRIGPIFNMVCPNCGTPAFTHPDRIRGEDALPLPPEALIAGRETLENFVSNPSDPPPHYNWKDIEALAESVFRAMLEKCSKP